MPRMHDGTRLQRSVKGSVTHLSRLKDSLGKISELTKSFSLDLGRKDDVYYHLDWLEKTLYAYLEDIGNKVGMEFFKKEEDE